LIRRRLSAILLLSGAAALGYVGFQYGATLVEQRHLQALWMQQQRISSATIRRTSAAVRENSLTRLTVPSIDLSAVIVEGTDPLSLLIGPGHLTGTALPGEAGNAVVSAHRDTFFRNIVYLKRGDQILVERDGHKFTYAVEGFRIVKPADLSVIAPTRDNRLTLITCDPAYYLGAAPQRLVVISRMLTSPEEVSASNKASKHFSISHSPQARMKLR
jgi:sortase A